MREGEIVYSSSLYGLFGLLRPIEFQPVSELKYRVKYCLTWWADSAGEAMDKVDKWVGGGPGGGSDTHECRSV